MCSAGEYLPGIGNLHSPLLVGRRCAPPASAAGMASLCVQKQVRNTCWSLFAEPRNRGKVFRRVAHHLNLRSFQRVGYQRKCFFHHAIYVDVHNFSRSGCAKIQQVVTISLAAKGLLHNLLDNACFGSPSGQLFREHLDVVGDYCQRRILLHARLRRPAVPERLTFPVWSLLFHALALGFTFVEKHNRPMRSPDLLTNGVMEHSK